MSGKKLSHTVLLSSLLCICALLIAACGGGSTPTTGPTTGTSATPAAAPADKQVLRFPIGDSDFSSLDPAKIALSTDIFAVHMFHSGLVQLTGTGEVIDQMASSHQISEDGLSYTFKLKPNVTFSDGTPVTTNDIAYSINRVMQPETKAALASFLAPIKGYDQMLSGEKKSLIGESIIAQDESTLIVQLSNPTPSFLSSFAFPISFPVNKKLIDKYGDKWVEHLEEGAGAGPFKVSKYERGKGLTLVPNETYYGKKPKLQKVELFKSGNPATTYKSYRANQVDLAEVPSGDVKTIEKDPDYKSVLGYAITYLTMNYMAKPFNNIKIRQAFALALDKEIMAETVMHGTAVPTNHLMPENMPGVNKSLNGPAGINSPKGDAAKAKQLLQEGMQEEGYADISQLPTIKFSYVIIDPETSNLISVLVERWKSVLGVAVVPENLSIDLLLQQMTATTGKDGPLQFWFLQYGGLPDPQHWLSVIFGKGAAFNNLNYGQNNSATAAEQQAVQDLLQKADTNLNLQERAQQYNEAEQKLVEHVAWLPLFQSERHVVVNPKLQNYPIYPLGIIAPDEWGEIYFIQ